MKKRLGLFEAYGIELEFMIVDQSSLKPLSICDQVLSDLFGSPTMSIEEGAIAWSNELALHVIELKCNGPQADLDKIEVDMAQAVKRMNLHLKRYHAKLLPTAMHPFLKPDDPNLKLWSGEDNEIYSIYDEIFSCKGHGWINLQSIHINLPFANDEEFHKLHSAIRILLALLPPFAASSPFVEGRPGPLLDSRLHYYLQNQRRIPSIIGDAIPEAVKSEDEYHRLILEPMYKDIAPLDKNGLLQFEWLNSRAAIARFDRHAIEIRILDIQESIKANFKLINAVIHALQALMEISSSEDRDQISQESLKNILMACLDSQGSYNVKDRDFVKLVGGQESVSDIFLSLASHAESIDKSFFSMNLSERILKNTGQNPSDDVIAREYHKLAKCLEDDSIYES